MSFIMQATQAVSPYKPANYHVTPSPQQHTYMPPVHAYGYHYGNQGLGVGAHSPMTPSQRFDSVATPAASGTKRSSVKGKKSVTKSKPAKKTKATKSATKQTKSKAKKSNVAIYDRAEKSLGNLAKAFMDVFADKPIAP